MIVSPQASVPYCNNLLPGETLFSDQAVWSPNHGYLLNMQGDGNLVLYRYNGAYQALWSSRTGGQNGNRVTMQRDGNLVVYNTANAAVWWTGTMYPGTRLEMQDDGNVVQYLGATALWATSWHRQAGLAEDHNTGDLGQCTWYAKDRFYQFSGSPSTGGYHPALTGDAYQWSDSAQAKGWLVRPTPSTQAIVVFQRGANGLNPLKGHVAWVDFVKQNPDGTTWIHVWDMNNLGAYQIHDHWYPHIPGQMSYILAPAL